MTIFGSTCSGTRFAGISVVRRMWADNVVLVKNHPKVPVSDLDMRIVVSLRNENLIPRLTRALVAEQILGTRELLDTGTEIVIGQSRLEQQPFYGSLCNIESILLSDTFSVDKEFEANTKTTAAKNLEKAAEKAKAESIDEFLGKFVMSYHESVYSTQIKPKLVFAPVDSKAFIKCLHLSTLYAQLKIFGIEEAKLNFSLIKKIEMFNTKLPFFSDMPNLVGRLLQEVSVKDQVLTTSPDIIAELNQLKKCFNPKNIMQEIDKIARK
ncbi:MAG: hypothetical protein ACPL1Z_05480 [Candidatus Bathyarchaeales archaeon]